MSTQLTTEETIARVFNLPRFAPLSLSFLSHIIDLPISPDSLRNSKPVHDGLDALLPRLVIARREVAQRLRAVSASQSVSMEWFRQELALITQRKQAHNLPDVVRQRKRYPITDPT